MEAGNTGHHVTLWCKRKEIYRDYARKKNSPVGVTASKGSEENESLSAGVMMTAMQTRAFTLPMRRRAAAIWRGRRATQRRSRVTGQRGALVTFPPTRVELNTAAIIVLLFFFFFCNNSAARRLFFCTCMLRTEEKESAGKGWVLFFWYDAEEDSISKNVFFLFFLFILA